MAFPCESTTVGTRFELLPLASDKEPVPVLEASTEMDCTGQTSKVALWPLRPLLLAKMWVNPGTAAVTCTWLLFRPAAVVLVLATLGSVTDQVRGPTKGVMSLAPLKTVAWKFSVWFCGTQAGGGESTELATMFVTAGWTYTTVMGLGVP